MTLRLIARPLENPTGACNMAKEIQINTTDEDADESNDEVGDDEESSIILTTNEKH